MQVNEQDAMSCQGSHSTNISGVALGTGLFLQVWNVLIQCTLLWKMRRSWYHGSACELYLHPRCFAKLHGFISAHAFQLDHDTWADLSPFYNPPK